MSDPWHSDAADNIPPLLHILTSASLLHLTSLHCYISSPLCPCSICQHPSIVTYPHLCVAAPSDIPPLLHILTSVSLLHLTSLHCYISSPLCRCSICQHPSTATYPHLCVAAPSANIPPLLHILTSVFAVPPDNIPPLLHILTSVSLLHLPQLTSYYSQVQILQRMI